MRAPHELRGRRRSSKLGKGPSSHEEIHPEARGARRQYRGGRYPGLRGRRRGAGCSISTVLSAGSIYLWGWARKSSAGCQADDALGRGPSVSLASPTPGGFGDIGRHADDLTGDRMGAQQRNRSATRLFPRSISFGPQTRLQDRSKASSSTRTTPFRSRRSRPRWRSGWCRTGSSRFSCRVPETDRLQKRQGLR